MSSSILPGRFDNGDFECWLREFNACCDANGWKVTEERDDKILKCVNRLNDLALFARGHDDVNCGEHSFPICVLPVRSLCK